MALITVSLTDLHFFARHGVLPQETVTGNDFAVNVELETEASDLEKMVEAEAEELSYTVSYADVYDVIREEMEKPRQLLETVAIRIGKRLKNSFPEIISGSISITKVTPPIPGITGSATVSYRF